MKKLAIIGSGVTAKFIAVRAKELNMESHCFSWKKEGAAYGVADVFHEVDVKDVDRIEQICREVGIDGVLATTELTILPAAQLAERLSLPGNPVCVARDVTNKYLMRNKVASVAGLNQPRFWLWESGALPEPDSYPVIVKPIAAGGKRGVCVAASRESMADAVREAAPYSRVSGVLIEQYLDGGTEYSVESLSCGGKHYVVQVTQKVSSGPPHCKELGHRQPAALSVELRAKVERVISDMLAAVGIVNGPCHTEIKIIDGEIYLIEINGRPGGDHITYPLTELSTGYPFVSAMIRIALGDFAGYEPTALRHNYCGVYFVTEETAYLQPLFEKCESYPWLYKKNKMNDGPSKLIFNDEDNLNYFIYYSENELPDIEKLAIDAASQNA